MHAKITKKTYVDCNGLCLENTFFLTFLWHHNENLISGKAYLKDANSSASQTVRSYVIVLKRSPTRCLVGHSENMWFSGRVRWGDWTINRLCSCFTDSSCEKNATNLKFSANDKPFIGRIHICQTTVNWNWKACVSKREWKCCMSIVSNMTKSWQKCYNPWELQNFAKILENWKTWCWVLSWISIWTS